MIDREVVEHALRIAIDWELGLMDAQSCDPDDVAHSEKLIAGYRRVLRKRYGSDRSFQEQLMDQMSRVPNVSVYDVIKEMGDVQQDN